MQNLQAAVCNVFFSNLQATPASAQQKSISMEFSKIYFSDLYLVISLIYNQNNQEKRATDNYVFSVDESCSEVIRSEANFDLI